MTVGILDKLLDLFAGEAPEVKAARRAMQADLATDPRRGFVVGMLAVSYEVDPGYLKAHATEALTDWYDVRTAAAIEAYQFGVPDRGAYDAYRHAFLARAGFAAGLLPELRSWQLAFQQAALVTQRYRSWPEYGEGYLQGHLAYRRSQGDPPARLGEIEASTRARLTKLAGTRWAALPFG